LNITLTIEFHSCTIVYHTPNARAQKEIMIISYASLCHRRHQST